jgi:hypothetical protein
LYRLDCSAPSAGVRLLAILSPGDLAQNNVLEFLIEESDITLDMLYVGPDLPLPASVPDHDLAMVAICETVRNRPLLKHIEALANSWPRPLLCAPDRIARLSRDGACRLLHSAPGIVVPVTRRLERDAVAALGRDAVFPLIARPVDSQKGHGLMKLDNTDAVEDHLKSRPESAFYIAPYVDYRGPDGRFRKYRIVLIDQRPYVCHMAISDSWVVHYMSAGMVESAVKRAEEARFFETFDDEFAHRHRHALASIGRKLELEYVGIDCGETPAGELLVFEVDSGMTVHAMDSINNAEGVPGLPSNADGSRGPPSVRHGVDDVIHSDTYAERGEPFGILGVVGVFPGVAKVHVVADGYHQAAVVVVNAPPVRRTAGEGILFVDPVAVDVLRAGYLVPVVQIEHGMEDGVLIGDIDDGAVGEHFLHAVDEDFPLVGGVEIVAHEESAAQQEFAEFHDLLVGEFPVAHFDGVEPRVVEYVIVFQQIDGLLHAASVNPCQTP